ncbi:MAG: hypothetical protein HFG27_01345 [Provencibacterium sp.]|jgi:flagellar hook assembly protein FlgD|nr:hypothetical protein [Provencibacterium sp.]
MSNSIDSARDYFSSSLTGSSSTNSSNRTGQAGAVYNAIFSDEDKDAVSAQDFLNLMVAQLRNQDFMNPVDDTQYVTQLAQFATMQQMQELGEYTKTNYAMSLVGKNVTVARFNVSGGVDKAVGPIQKLSLVNGEYQIYVQDKAYTLDQIMEVNADGKVNADGSLDISGKTLQASVEGNTVSLEWPAATLDASLAENLTYSLYYSQSKEMDTVEDVEANGMKVAMKGSLTKDTITGLKPGTYFANVIVTDKAGRKSVYQKATFEIQQGPAA